MKKSGKIFAALLALFAVLTLFAACGKGAGKEKNTTEKDTVVQVNANPTEDTTADVTTVKEETTKAVNTTKVQPTTKAQSTTKAQNDAATTNKNEATTKEDFIAPNIDLLIGTWDTTIDVEGLPVSVEFEFSIFNQNVEIDFTKTSYDNMIEKAVEMDLAQVTDEEIVEAGFVNREEYEKAVREYLISELPYDELRGMIRATGKWSLIGDTLTVTIAGETATAETKLSEEVTTFDLTDSYGDTITLIRR